MQIKIQFNATLPITLSKRGRLFVASCSILDIHSQGETEPQARNNLGEALSLFFVSCFDRGVLDDVLRDCGFKAVPVVQPIESDTQTGEFINVPILFRG